MIPVEKAQPKPDEPQLWRHVDLDDEVIDRIRLLLFPSQRPARSQQK